VTAVASLYAVAYFDNTKYISCHKHQCLLQFQNYNQYNLQHRDTSPWLRRSDFIAMSSVKSQHFKASSPYLQPVAYSTLSYAKSKQLSEFALFPKLPAELRIRVWSFTMFPRMVSFIPGGGKAPAILSVCHESRKQTRKFYRLCIHVSSPKGHIGIRKAPEFGVFINSDVDIIYFTPTRRFSGFDRMTYSEHGPTQRPGRPHLCVLVLSSLEDACQENSTRSA
jgi:hypothetical protein